jgi:hypothetical protein
MSKKVSWPTRLGLDRSTGWIPTPASVDWSWRIAPLGWIRQFGCHWLWVNLTIRGRHSFFNRSFIVAIMDTFWWPDILYVDRSSFLYPNSNFLMDKFESKRSSSETDTLKTCTGNTVALKQLFLSIRIHNTTVFSLFSEVRRLLNNSEVLIPVQSGSNIPLAAGPLGFRPLPRRSASRASNWVHVIKKLDQATLGWGSVISPLRPMPWLNPKCLCATREEYTRPSRSSTPHHRLSSPSPLPPVAIILLFCV